MRLSLRAFLIIGAIAAPVLAMISSGEQEAEIYYVIEGGMSSNTVVVQAFA
jgi:hypothetical protein